MRKDHYSKFKKNSPFLLTAEHASGRIPQEYKKLGLSKNKCLMAKDLYDPGSLALLKVLEKKMSASYLYSNISRLVIDYNRVLGMKNNQKNTYHSGAMKKELLVEIGRNEELINIPGNTFLREIIFEKEEKRRYQKYVEPYRLAGEELICRIKNRHKKAIILSIHSFFPVYAGKERKVDIGVLYTKSKKTGKALVKFLQKKTKLVIGDNQPWKMNEVGGGIFGALQMEKGADLIAFDINNKNLKTKKDIEKIASLIFQSFKEVL